MQVCWLVVCGQRMGQLHVQQTNKQIASSRLADKINIERKEHANAWPQHWQVILSVLTYMRMLVSRQEYTTSSIDEEAIDDQLEGSDGSWPLSQGIDDCSAASSEYVSKFPCGLGAGR